MAVASTESNFQKFTTASPPPLETIEVNGAKLHLYGYRQLEFLSHKALRSRMLEIQYAFSKAGIEVPLPPSARSDEEMIRWILGSQAYFTEGVIREDTLINRFGTPSYFIKGSMIEKMCEREQRHITPKPRRKTSDPNQDNMVGVPGYSGQVQEEMEDWRVHDKPRGDVMFGDLPRYVGHGKRRLSQPEHHMNGVPTGNSCDRRSSPDKVGSRRYIGTATHLDAGLCPTQDYSETKKRSCSPPNNYVGRANPHSREDYYKAEGLEHPWVKYGGEPTEIEYRPITEGRKHNTNQFQSSMINCGTSEDSKKRNEQVPGHGHGPKYVDPFFKTSVAGSGTQNNYRTSWRTEPKSLSGTNMAC